MSVNRKVRDEGTQCRAMSQHTPGPWKVGEEDEILAGINGVVVAVANHNRPQVDANARLIAAAPELLAALKAIVRITDGSQPKDYPGALMVARAAIAKATGQEG